MTRSARKRTETVTVEELLRRTGATARKIGPPAPRIPVADLLPEPLARVAAGARSKPGRAGARTRRFAVSSGMAVVLGGLLVLALVPDDVPCAQTTLPDSLPAVPLPPATVTSSVADGTAAPVSTNIEVVAVTKPARPSPKPTAKPVSPSRSTTSAPASEDPAPVPPGYPGYPPYPGYPGNGYPYPPYGPPR